MPMMTYYNLNSIHCMVVTRGYLIAAKTEKFNSDNTNRA